MSFKKDAAKHQKDYFHKDELQIDGNFTRKRAQIHWLNEDAATDGKNFYNGYEVFGIVKKGRKKDDVPEWFLDTLRSQHIPFNFFIPLDNNKELAIKVLNELFNLKITKIDKIEIEYPPHEMNPLFDRTSFDAFISYSENNKKGFIGIEVKYTEGGYSPTKKEHELFKDDEKSIYYHNTNTELYVNPKNQLLKKNAYRQIWRNHLLASCFEKEKYDQFISATFYPAGNTHFTNAICMFQTFLTRNGRKTLTGITYEDFFATLTEYAETDKQRNWISYLITRYLF